MWGGEVKGGRREIGNGSEGMRVHNKGNGEGDGKEKGERKGVH